MDSRSGGLRSDEDGTDVLIVRGARIDPLDGWGDEGVVNDVIAALASGGIRTAVAHIASPQDVVDLGRPRLVAFPNSRWFLDDRGRKHSLQELLRRCEIPFIGSGPEGHAARSKLHMKRVLADHSVPTPRWRLVDDHNVADGINDLTFPVVVKPEAGSESVGVIRADDSDALDGILSTMSERSSLPALVEEWARHREFTVAVLGNGPGRRGFPMEVVLPVGEDFLSEDVKLHRLAETPAPVAEDDIRDRLEELAIATSVALQVADMARVDILQNDRGDMYVIDVNTFPGLRHSVEHISYFPFCLNYGCDIDYRESIIALLAVSLHRHDIIMPPKVRSVFEKVFAEGSPQD